MASSSRPPQLIESLGSSSRWYRPLEELGRTVSVVILDEAHVQYQGKRTEPALRRLFNASSKAGVLRVRLGMTATPTARLRCWLGPLVYHASTEDAMLRGILVGRLWKVRYRTLIAQVRPEDGGGRLPRDVWRIAIGERASVYAEKVAEWMERVRVEIEERVGVSRVPKALVVAPNVTEAEMLERTLERILNSRSRLEGVEVLRADYTVEKARRVIDRFRDLDQGAVLVTVNMADIGFDDPNLEILFIARKISNLLAYIQVRGRVLRANSQEHNAKSVLGCAIVIDLVGETPDEIRDRDRLLRAEVRVFEEGEEWFPPRAKPPVIMRLHPRRGVWSRRRVGFIVRHLMKGRSVRVRVGKGCFVDFTVERTVEGAEYIVVAVVKGGAVRWGGRVRVRSKRRKTAASLYNLLTGNLPAEMLLYLCSK